MTEQATPTVASDTTRLPYRFARSWSRSTEERRHERRSRRSTNRPGHGCAHWQRASRTAFAGEGRPEAPRSAR